MNDKSVIKWLKKLYSSDISNIKICSGVYLYSFHDIQDADLCRTFLLAQESNEKKCRERYGRMPYPPSANLTIGYFCKSQVLMRILSPKNLETLGCLHRAYGYRKNMRMPSEVDIPGVFGGVREMVKYPMHQQCLMESQSMKQMGFTRFIITRISKRISCHSIFLGIRFCNAGRLRDVGRSCQGYRK